ncbi:MAG: thioredoxin family protein [Betaproteobacteria bacterium]|nr:thioredoxin family protein [Betaproteobacteria bacterium]
MSRAPLAHVRSMAELDALIAGPLPLLVTFTGPKCMICRQLAPMLDAVVAEAGASLASAKVDAEALAEVSGRFEIRALPTTLLFRGGQLADRIAGFSTAASLRAWLKGQGVALAA